MQTFYPLQEPLGPAAEAVNSDPHLGEWSYVQDFHEKGIILLPLKSGGGKEEHETGKLAMVRGLGHARNQIQGQERAGSCATSPSVPSDSPIACLLHPRCVPKILS